MNELKCRSEAIQSIANVEYHLEFPRDDAKLVQYKKVPLAEVSALGVAIEPLTTAIQSHIAGGSAGAGIYRVSFPAGVSGQLASFQNENAFLGTIVNNTGIAGQARLTPLACNPTYMFMAAALMGINKKLDEIQETQRQILSLLERMERREKSRLRGNLNFLSELMEQYKHSWNNAMFKSSNHVQVLTIKKEAEQSIDFYRGEIEQKSAEKLSALHIDQDVKKRVEDIQSDLKEYQLALHLFSFAAFLEVMLSENYDAAYLDGVARKIEDYALQYRGLYSDCYTLMERYTKSSIQAHLLGGIASASKGAGDLIAKVPYLSKTQLDETLLEAGCRLENTNEKRARQSMGRLSDNRSSGVGIFAENIKMVNRLYNEPMEVLFDREHIYFGLPESGEQE